MAAGLIGPIASRRRSALAVLAAAALLLAGCGGDDEPELTFEQRLAELEGRPLEPFEVAERADIGHTLCQLDDRILDEMWQRLDDDQLGFQDAVIATLCPERAVLYAGHTGRMVTDEAEQSGVRTSTTRPTSSTTTTTRRGTTGPTTTSTPGDGASTDSSSASSSSSTPTPLPPTGSATTTTRGPTTS